MALLFIGSTGDQAGHTLITWAIIRRLLEKGYRTGFFKPFGNQVVNNGELWTDHDAELFKAVLNLDEPLDRICPYPLVDQSWRQKEPSEILRECKGLAMDLAEDKDVLVVMGSRHIFSDDALWPVPGLSLITELTADFVLINRFRKASSSIYSILVAYSLLKDRMKGVFINRVPPENMDEARDSVVSSLAAKGVEISALVAADPLLSLWSLREIRDMLDAEVLWGEEKLDRPIGRMTVGSAALKDSALLFKRVYNKIVFLDAPPSGSEIEAASFGESVAGILLTGGIKPPRQIVEAAASENIPLILTKEDTFAVIERSKHITQRLSLNDESKVRYFTELLDRDNGLERLLERL
ncbi:MAG: DRTGG domain-containing protein [Syntrophobacteraceae bacterium]